MDYDDDIDPTLKNQLEVMSQRDPKKSYNDEVELKGAHKAMTTQDWDKCFSKVFKDTQSDLARLRAESKTKARRKFKAKILGELAEDSGPLAFDGSVTKCVICMENFAANDPVCRLVCRHVLHEDCLSHYKTSASGAGIRNPSCPECRGTLEKAKNFKYIHENQFECVSDSSNEGSPSPKIRTVQTKDPLVTVAVPVKPTQSREPSSLGSSLLMIDPQDNSFMPAWQLDETQDNESLCYHGNTSLRDGRQGLLVDPGAWSNLAGESWIQNMAIKATNSGYRVAQGPLERPLRVAGVGKSPDRAEWEVRVPIALVDSEGQGVLHEYHAPVIGGTGKNLPALLGLQSMSRQNAVLEMAPGSEYLTLPGAGGYTVHWSPGTIRYKLEKAPSGHLILPCDEFKKVSSHDGGVEEPVMTFFGSHRPKVKTCEIGTQTDNIQEPVKKAHVNRKGPLNS